jgi:long-subunit fatty acid transport protein
MLEVLLSLTLVGSMSPDVGTTGFNFLRVTPTAREAAMGSVAVGFSDNAFGIWYNPAGIAGHKNAQVGAGYVSYLAGVQSGVLSFVKPLKGMNVGIGAYYLNSGWMKRTDENNTDLGRFCVSYLALDFTGSMKLAEMLSLGAGIKAIYGGIDSFRTIGLAADIGATYALPVSGLRASAVVRNLGVALKPYQTQKDKLPLAIAAGFGYDVAPGWKLGLEVNKPFDNNFELRLGAEGWVHKYFCLRAGMTTAGGDLKSGGGWDILAGLSGGLGVRVNRLELDYSFTPMVILGNTHRVSLQWNLF